MGSREKNFYNQLACRMGFEEAAREVQDLYLAGEHRAAAAAVPLEFIDQTALIGPPERIAERIERYAAAGVTTLAVTPHAPSLDERRAVLRALAELVPATAGG
jgi:alkanesulfonate monooxygenase SsuD/methylene tetrahydromethanopterin reductase-like flavin-dependent oxidoreductase (luciferase family)